MAITVSNIFISIFGIFLLGGFGSLGLLALVGGWMVILIWACTSNVEPKAA